MDPLSITTGILAVIGALSVTIDSFSDWKEAPHDIQELAAQLRNLNGIAERAIEITRTYGAQNSGHALLCSVNERLNTTRRLFEKRIPISQSKSSLRTTWMTRRKEIKKLSKEIVAIRNDLNMALNLSTLLIMSQNRHAFCPGLSNSSLERSTVFYPETYIIEQPLYQHLIVFSMMELNRTSSSRVDKYYILCPTKRHWRRVTVIALTSNVSKWSEVSSTNLCAYKTLPGLLQAQLETFLQAVEMSTFVTTLQIELEDGAREVVQFNPDNSVISEDLEESSDIDTSRYIEEIRWRNLPQYDESQVITLGREAQCFFVCVESQICVELKMPFYGRTQSFQRPIEDFIESMNMMLAAQGCVGVARFKGVVTSGGQIRGYLLQAPRQGSMWSLIANAVYTGHLIPWTRKERWFRQLLTMTAEIHKRGMALGFGPDHYHNLWVNEVDELDLISMRSHVHHHFKSAASVPPEVGNPSQPSAVGSYRASMQTDIFNLGYLLWAIVRNARVNVADFCRWSNCTTEPSRWCTEDHSCSDTLTPCARDGIPAYVDMIIQQCRQKELSKRPSAAALLEMIPQEANDRCVLSATKDLTPWRNKERPPQNMACDRCGTPTGKKHYHCNICSDGDFDTCVPCYSIGVRCYDNSHVLVLRVARNGAIVNMPAESAND